jgi:MFS family permease
MENMDSTVIATSLPAIAADIGTSPLTLKLAITSYLLSLAVFIPASGWTADRFGARAVFSVAIGVFMVGSIGCAMSTSITHFVIARIIQGIGGAMMTPVGRLVLLRSIDKSALVNAMAWVTMPALIGPVIGPPLGGFITTYFSWHWIFLINIPIGLLGIWLALKYIDPIKSENPERFDVVGLVLAGLGVAGLAFGLSVAGLGLLSWQIVMALIVGGFFRSLQFTAINTMAYAEVTPGEMSRATTLVSVNQQLAISAGVAVGAFAVEATMAANHSVELGANDFWPAFLIVAVLSALSAYSFWKLPEDAGHEISGHRVPEVETPQAAEAAAAEQTHDARDQKLG